MSPAMDFTAVREAARHNWPSIVAYHGIKVPDNRKRSGPCPICRAGTDRFTFYDKEGRGTWFCRKCPKPGAGDGFHLLQQVFTCDFRSAVERVQEALGQLDGFSSRRQSTKKATGATRRCRLPPGKLGQTLFCYEHADGSPVFYKQRIKNPDGTKFCPQWGPTEDGTGWQNNMEHVKQPRPLYNLPAILADPHAVVVVHEGEPCVHAHLNAGLPGIPTTCSGGAGKAHLTDFSPLAGRVVLMSPDNDPPGEQHAQAVGQCAHQASVQSIKILRLPGLPEKGDVVDWLNDGGTQEQFSTLMEGAEEMERPQSHENVLHDEPVSLDTLILPALPTEAFPGWLRAMVESVAEATETPVELAALQRLTVLSASCQRKFIVHVNPGYVEPLSLWTMTALESGNRKTTVMHTMAKPLMEYERRQGQSKRAEIERVQSEHDLIKARIDGIRARAAKGTSEDFEEAKAEIQALQGKLPDIPVVNKLWVQDITPEKLGEMMAENGERLALLSDEAGIFSIMGGQYNKGVANLDIFLQSHSGFPYRVHRRGRPPIDMQHPALAIGLSPQPLILRDLGDNKAFRGRGLLARYIYAIPRSKVGSRTFAGRPVAEHVAAQYQAHIEALLTVDPPQTVENEIGVYTLYLEEAAVKEWHEFCLHVEGWMREGGPYEHMRDWAGKLPGAVVRLAGNLHCASYALGQPWMTKISCKTMNEAIGLAVVLGQHALAAFDMMALEPRIEDARKLWRWIVRKKKALFMARECFQDLRGSFKTMEPLNRALGILVERFYLCHDQQASTGGGLLAQGTPLTHA
jgi:hypothetical protein